MSPIRINSINEWFYLLRVMNENGRDDTLFILPKLGIAVIVVKFNLSNCVVSSIYNKKRAATSHINDIKFKGAKLIFSTSIPAIN